MADEILRSKHAFGEFANLDKAIADGKIDAYDILFLDGKTEPKIGWVDKDGNVVILEDKKQVMVVDSLPETGNEDTIYICESTFYFWNGSEFVASADNAGVSEDFVNARFDDAVSEANAYTDEKVKALADGAVATNTANIAQNDSDIASLRADVDAITAIPTEEDIMDMLAESGVIEPLYADANTVYTDNNGAVYIL